MCNVCIREYINEAMKTAYRAGETWITRERDRGIHPSLLVAINAALETQHIPDHNSVGYREFIIPICNILGTEWPHECITDPSQVAYTRSFEHGRADRQTTCKLGGYITKHLPMLSGAQVETIVSKYKNLQALQFSIVTDEALVNAMFRTLAHSCMHPCAHNGTRWDEKTHPYRAYSSRTGWGMAIRTDGNGEGKARSIIRLNEKTYARIYGSYPNGECTTRGDDPALREWLTTQGFKPTTNFVGCKLERIPHPRSKEHFIAPYIDGDIKMCSLDKTDEYSLIVSRNGNWSLGRTDGLSQKQFEDREGMIQLGNGNWALPENAVATPNGIYLRTECLPVPRHDNQLYYRGYTRLVNGVVEWVEDLKIVCGYDGDESYILNDTPCAHVATFDRDAPMDAVYHLWNDTYEYIEDCIQLSGGKHSGLYALATDTVTRKKDSAIMLRAFAGHTAYRIDHKQWEIAIGDRVMLTEEGINHFGESTSNPRSVIGTVVNFDSYERSCTVRWANGRENCYNKEYLKLIMTLAQYAIERQKLIANGTVPQTLEAGDRVELTASGLDCYGSQSNGLPGTIRRIIDQARRGHCYEIRWDNSHQNSYRASDVQFYIPLPAQTEVTTHA